MSGDIARRAYTAEEAAEALGVSKATVQRMAKDGRLNPLDLGVRRLLFSPHELDRVVGGTAPVGSHEET